MTINDELALALTVEERPATNDGEFTAAYTIPADAAAGDEVCGQAFASGNRSSGGFDQARSNRVCFTVAAGSASSSPAGGPVAPAPAPAHPVSRSAAAGGGPAPVLEAPTDVLGEQLAAPASRTPAEAVSTPMGPQVTETAGAELPRTGRDTRRGSVLAGGLVVMLGGLALMTGNIGRRRTPGPADRDTAEKN